MRSMRSAQRQVELRRLVNQLPLLVKAYSVCKVVTFCEFCLFATYSVPRDKNMPGAGYRSSGKLRVASR